MVIHVCDLIVCSLLIPRLVLFRVFSPISSSTCSLTCTSSMWTSSGHYPTGTPSTEESGPSAGSAPLTGHEPNILDDFHNSETTEIFVQVQSSDAVPSYLFDTELSDETIGRALSSPLFIQEREEPADRRQALFARQSDPLFVPSVMKTHTYTFDR